MERETEALQRAEIEQEEEAEEEAAENIDESMVDEEGRYYD